MLTTVTRDSGWGWRVECPVCGPLACYRNFWVARRDQVQHEEGHQADEKEEAPRGGRVAGGLADL